MMLTFQQLKKKMPELTELAFSHPVSPKKGANEIWIKFRNEGRYVFISFEQPIPEKIEMLQLVGSGNALNCSEQKKDDAITQYNNLAEIKKTLSNSINYKWNMPETVKKVTELFENFTERFLY